MLRDCHRNKAKKWTMDSRLSIILFVINYFSNAHLYLRLPVQLTLFRI